MTDWKKVLQYAAIGAAAGIAGFAAAKYISDSRMEDDLEGFLPNHPENGSFLWHPPEAEDLPLADITPTPDNMPFEEEVEVEEIDIEE